MCVAPYLADAAVRLECNPFERMDCNTNTITTTDMPSPGTRSQHSPSMTTSTPPLVDDFGVEPGQLDCDPDFMGLTKRHLEEYEHILGDVVDDHENKDRVEKMDKVLASFHIDLPKEVVAKMCGDGGGGANGMPPLARLLLDNNDSNGQVGLGGVAEDAPALCGESDLLNCAATWDSQEKHGLPSIEGQMNDSNDEECILFAGAQHL